jgi:hypothetical protein
VYRCTVQAYRRTGVQDKATYSKATQATAYHRQVLISKSVSVLQLKIKVTCRSKRQDYL